MPEFDVVDGVWTVAPPEGKDIRLDTSGTQGHIRMSGVVKLDNAAGADPASALLMGVGTDADPALTAVADQKFIELRTKTTATSGDGRCVYLRHVMAGAGASGDCIRAVTNLLAAAATARGAQISLEVGDTGYVSGLGVGVDAQLYVKGAVVPAGGTYAALNAEIYGETSANISAVTALSFIRCVNNGNATAMGLVDDKAFLFNLEGFVSGAAKLWYDHAGNAPAQIEEWIKIKTPGGTRWIPAYNAVV